MMRACRPSRAMMVGLVALVVSLAAATVRADAETLLRTRLNADIRSTDPGTNRDANNSPSGRPRR